MITAEDVRTLFGGICVGVQARVGCDVEASRFIPPGVPEPPRVYDPDLLRKAIESGALYESLR